MDNNALWYINGRWVHPSEATISINDIGVLRGYSAFESLRTYNRRPFHLDAHLDRLYRSTELIELEMPYERRFVADIVREIIARNTYTHASIRILVTGGESEDGILPMPGRAGLVVLITPLAERDLERFARGCALITSRLQRDTPEAKTGNYLAAVRSLKEAQRRDATDALFVNEQGHVLEATRSNFFVFHGDTLITPREGILLGITREVVLELARRFTIQERPIRLDELPRVDEAFITSSSKEITPVVRIDEWMIGDGKPGPRTYELEQRFIAMVERGEF
ncbi:MAG TPA: aminotransferase class IV [Ktedonosporobacter sp.]|nr:aminotransferase class IV [Ktedonosporobacter sp.]